MTGDELLSRKELVTKPPGRLISLLSTPMSSSVGGGSGPEGGLLLGGGRAIRWSHRTGGRYRRRRSRFGYPLYWLTGLAFAEFAGWILVVLAWLCVAVVRLCWRGWLTWRQHRRG
jgi:hypothetical protein